jgi:hypothetical protein
MKIDNKIHNNLTNAAAQVQAVRGAQAIAEAARGAKHLAKTARQYVNASHGNHLAGRIFEDMHVATANVDAALKGLPQRFDTTASVGLPHDVADIVAKVGGKTVASAQAKLSDSSTALVRSISSPKYDGMQKIVPSDKALKVRRIAAGLSKGGRRPDLSLKDTAKGVTDRVTYKGVSSKPVSLGKAQQAAKQPEAVAKAMEREAAQVAYGAAALMGGGMSGIVTAMQGGSAKDVLNSTAKGVARGVIQQAATIGVSKVGIAAITQVASKATASAFSRSGAPGAIAGAGISICSDLLEMHDGKITGRECATRAASHGVRAGTTWAGAEAGACIGVVGGPIGIAVGAFVGGVVGSFVPDLFSKLFLQRYTSCSVAVMP